MPRHTLAPTHWSFAPARRSLPIWRAGCRVADSGRHILLATARLFIFAAAGSAGAQEMAVDRLFPPAVSAQVTSAGANSAQAPSTVAVEGKLPKWPVNVWCDRQDVKIIPAEKSGQLTVQVAPDSPGGIAWVRLHDDASASPLLPLFIDQAAVVTETEPNDRLTQANRVDLPAGIVGKLEKGGDVDAFLVSVPAGQSIVVTTRANRFLASPMDAVLQLVDLSGNVLAQVDDTRGLDPQLRFASSVDGEYLIRLFAFPKETNSTIGFSGAATYVYHLQATIGPAFDYPLPMITTPAGVAPPSYRPVGWNLSESNPPKLQVATAVSPPIVNAAGAIGWFPLLELSGLTPPSSPAWVDAEGDGPIEIASLPAVISGHVERPTTLKKFKLTLQPGVKYRARAWSRVAGLQVDSVLTVHDAAGAQLAKNDDVGAERDASVDFALPAAVKEAAAVELRLSDLVGGHGHGHAFSLVVHPVVPSVAINSANQQFRCVAGKTVEIPVQIARQDGFAQSLRIVAEGLPQGVTVAEAVSEPKGDSAKEVKLTLQAAADVSGSPLRFQGPIRIVAYPVAPPTPEKAAEGAAPPAPAATSPIATLRHELRDGFRTDGLWLTVAAP